ILSAMNPAGVVEAVSSNNVAILQKVKGIGQKTAERIIVDLRGKIDKGVYISENVSPQHNTIRQEALSALSQLGFARQAAEKAVDHALKSGDLTSVEDVIRLALKYL
ncbi:MAG TPA: helix-hairpin-helix domain-containing protein, partial [Bacteroidales bacterium]|nr:helix-hairpin-helix domain-containing protein [Bacteroidales bacterium]